MELISALFVVALAAAPLAVLGGWLAGGRDRRLGLTSPAGGSETWWRQTMPWPQGVQEDDDVHWDFGRGDGPPRSAERVLAHDLEDLSVDPVRLSADVRSVARRKRLG